jgi:hypothetical protein
MELSKAKLHLDGEGGVSVTRTSINDQGLPAEAWAELIINGEPQQRPNPDKFGYDHWPDWEKLLAKASKKLLTKPREKLDRSKNDPHLPPKIGGKWFHSM